MIKVAGCWDIGYSAPLTEWDRWSYVLQDFGVDEWIMSPVSGISIEKKVTEVSDIQVAIDQNKNLTPVFLDEAATESLYKFEHPENVLYIFGKASYSPWLARKKEGIAIRIETPVSSGGFWPDQAISIVLYDRIRKTWQ